jgi:phage shock protein PspC (stress-responsive transcriptional regulator)
MSDFLIYITPFLGVAIATLLGFVYARAQHRTAAQLTKKVEDAQKKTEEHPDKAAPAWELAQATLEKYFHRNLNQVKWIFVVAILVMLAGFGVVLYGVALAMRPGGAEPSRIAALAGVITESIGATFIWVYRSTMQQASGFMRILDRINTVGMAIQILDSMPRGAEEGSLKNATRARLVQLLMTPAAVEAAMGDSPKPKKRTQHRKDTPDAV